MRLHYFLELVLQSHFQALELDFVGLLDFLLESSHLLRRHHGRHLPLHITLIGLLVEGSSHGLLVGFGVEAGFQGGEF